MSLNNFTSRNKPPKLINWSIKPQARGWLPDFHSGTEIQLIDIKTFSNKINCDQQMTIQRYRDVSRAPSCPRLVKCQPLEAALAHASSINPQSIRYPIHIQEAGNALATPLECEHPCMANDHLKCCKKL
ncbi:hypothetical protein EVAR_8687_1 [Eumeta japonica]|uniref:Uncharacterized protein n=1 Tax=Eumeta variegata TaxID=151549 RepID=A0A4C1TUL7_EUMVA|nr:hypothetical protein EVAR_8687_1 [Eumeta japonica]